MSEHGANIFIRYYFRKLKHFLFSKDILSFLFFLLLSFCFWFVHTIEKEKETNLIIPIVYKGIPQNFTITNHPPNNISITIKEKGIRLFSYYSGNSVNPLIIDLDKHIDTRKNSNTAEISNALIKSKLAQYLLPTSLITDMDVDSFSIRFEKLYEKEVPVHFNSNIELAPQYMLSQKIKLVPESIKIFGPKHLIDTIRFINTEKILITNLNDTTQLNCKLVAVNNLKYSLSSVRIDLFVEHYTEKKVQLPITSINCPPRYSLKTFPAFVNVVYNVGLSKFNSLSENDIQIFFDYNELKNIKTFKQKLKIKNNTSYISNIRIEPKEAEFLLEKN